MVIDYNLPIIDVSHILNPIIGRINNLISGISGITKYQKIGINGLDNDIFEHYNNKEKKINTRIKLLKLHQHLIAEIEYLFALSLGHRTRSDATRIVRSTALTKVISDENIRKKINANMHYGEMVSKYPWLFLINLQSHQYHPKLKGLIKILDNHQRQITDQKYTQFPWDDKEIKQLYHSILQPMTNYELN